MGVDPRLRDVAVDSVGDVWVTDCTWGGPGPLGLGARWYDGNAWSAGQTSSVVGSGCIEAIEVDGAGRSAGHRRRSVVLYTGTGWEEFAHPDAALPQDTRWATSSIILGGDRLLLKATTTVRSVRLRASMSAWASWAFITMGFAIRMSAPASRQALLPVGSGR